MCTLAKVIRVLVAMAVTISTPAYGRTITWEEEVPLNTGETIWIDRSMPWEMRGGFGNALDISMRPTRIQTIRFEYAGKSYTYTGRANVLLIAISPSKQPVLVAPAGDYGWYQENSYYCVVPSYVQLQPDSTGRTWTWPEKIESWLLGLRANLMVNIPLPDENRFARYTVAMRDVRDAIPRMQLPHMGRIDPT